MYCETSQRLPILSSLSCSEFIDQIYCTLFNVAPSPIFYWASKWSFQCQHHMLLHLMESIIAFAFTNFIFNKTTVELQSVFMNGHEPNTN